MKYYIVGQLNNVVIFVHNYKTKHERDEAYNDFVVKLQDTRHRVYMNWYASFIDNVQKSDCF